MTDFIQVITSVDEKETARKIADLVVEKRFGACVQIIGPVTSVYRWQGKIEEADEYLCQIKTTASLYRELESFIRDIHPYEVPEILAFPVLKGSGAYLDWLAGEVIRLESGLRNGGT